MGFKPGGPLGSELPPSVSEPLLCFDMLKSTGIEVGLPVIVTEKNNNKKPNRKPITRLLQSGRERSIKK